MIVCREWIEENLTELINTDSPVGYYPEIIELVAHKISEMGHNFYLDNRKNIYVRVNGRNKHQGIYLVTHLDTIGMMVSGINNDGSLNLHHLGGVNYNNLDGEYVSVILREGGKRSGICCCKSHSTHTYIDARDLPRNEANMRIFLDEKVHTKQQVYDLGIRNGDWVSVVPHVFFTDSGYIKSRFLDDKIGVLCSLYILKLIKEENLEPNSDIMFVFSNYEEIGQSGTKIEPGFSRYIAIDVAPFSDNMDSREDKVTIISRDHGMVYDYNLVQSIIGVAKNKGIEYAIDSYCRYSTDAETALLAGGDIETAALGLGVFSTHGVERTHVDSIDSTCELLKNIILEL